MFDVYMIFGRFDFFKSSKKLYLMLTPCVAIEHYFEQGSG